MSININQHAGFIIAHPAFERVFLRKSINEWTKAHALHDAPDLQFDPLDHC